MAGRLLTTASSLLCPHGGNVQFVATGGRVSAGGAETLSQAMTGTVSGCPFQIPAVVPIPSPCVQARIVAANTRTRIGGSPSVGDSAVILCFAATGLPQGPAIVVDAQPRARAQ